MEFSLKLLEKNLDKEINRASSDITASFALEGIIKISNSIIDSLCRCYKNNLENFINHSNDYEKSIYIKALYFRGGAFLYKEKFVLAINDLQKIDPNYKDTKYLLGYAKTRIKNFYAQRRGFSETTLPGFKEALSKINFFTLEEENKVQSPDDSIIYEIKDDVFRRKLQKQMYAPQKNTEIQLH